MQYTWKDTSGQESFFSSAKKSQARPGNIHLSPTGLTLEVRQLGAGTSFIPCDHQFPAFLNLDLHAHSETIQVAALPGGCTARDVWKVESNTPRVTVDKVDRTSSPRTMNVTIRANPALQGDPPKPLLIILAHLKLRIFAWANSSGVQNRTPCSRSYILAPGGGDNLGD